MEEVIVTHDEKCCKVSDKDEWCWVREIDTHEIKSEARYRERG
jgi:hypothetical protein